MQFTSTYRCERNHKGAQSLVGTSPIGNMQLRFLCLKGVDPDNKEVRYKISNRIIYHCSKIVFCNVSYSNLGNMTYFSRSQSATP